MEDDRNKRRRNTRSAPSARKAPPPEATGREARFIAEKKEEGGELRVHMRDGESFQGRIEYYDKEMIKIIPDSGPTVFIRKEQIRLIEEL
jgi:small nuclear ribonucleoprotein (snRNP)-like protein